MLAYFRAGGPGWQTWINEALREVIGGQGQAGQALEPSKAAFDADLCARDPRWGLRHLDAVSTCAGDHGLLLEGILPMSANNLSLLFRHAAPVAG